MQKQRTVISLKSGTIYPNLFFNCLKLGRSKLNPYIHVYNTIFSNVHRDYVTKDTFHDTELITQVP